jgi:hypothetical protein
MWMHLFQLAETNLSDVSMWPPSLPNVLIYAICSGVPLCLRFGPGASFGCVGRVAGSSGRGHGFGHVSAALLPSTNVTAVA